MTTAAVTPEQPQAATGATPAPPPAQGETEVFKQSFSFKIPKTQQGLEELFTDPEKKEINVKALLYVVRAGIKQILSNRVRQKFTEKVKETGKPAFEPVDGIYDATPLLLDAPIRKVLSQRDKLEKNLRASNLPDAVIQTMLSTFDQNVGTGDETGGNTAIETNEASVVWGGKDNKQLIMKGGATEEDDDE